VDVLSLDAAGPNGPVTLMALVVGLSALLFATTWRLVRLLRVRHGIASGLRDDDPVVREVAVVQAGEMGLAATAPTLLRAVRVEQDPKVLAAVVRTVAARQWEPASTGPIVELRLWAKAYAEKHPELRRGMRTEPMLPGIAGAVPPPSLDPARADEFRTRRDHVPDDHPDHAADVRLYDPPPDDDRLSPVRVLVTGAGGPAGVAVIRSLQRHGHHVIALDADPTAAGLRLADEHHVVPRADDPHYLAALVRVGTVCDAQALVCTVAEEYRALTGAVEYLEEAGIRTLLPSLRSVELCVDKWAFTQHLLGESIPVAATGLGTDEGVPGPWVVKPRFGRGSRDVVTANTRAQLAAALRRVPDPIVQTELSGREFTCDALVDRSGAVVATAPRWRAETRGGISTKGTTFEDPVVSDVASLVLKSVGLIGPANVQGFVSADGNVTVHEVNPRFSGGLPLTLAAGSDMVEEYLRDVLGTTVRPERLVARAGVSMTRYFCEVFDG
jgi:carbamoyl-phosphate synthase large subunit